MVQWAASRLQAARCSAASATGLALRQRWSNISGWASITRATDGCMHKSNKQYERLRHIAAAVLTIDSDVSSLQCKLKHLKSQYIRSSVV
jgi:hypothetical protein